MAPEVVDQEVHTTALDIWSAGGIIFEMVTGRQTKLTTWVTVEREKNPLEGIHLSKQLKSILFGTLNFTVKKRLEGSQEDERADDDEEKSVEDKEIQELREYWMHMTKKWKEDKEALVERYGDRIDLRIL
ncbi:hypothetical protein BGW39_001429 [Mortierella sp. 14UC]|nr:hypothetical protein BGW39_001429 [Mortierella sp. 14UC]